MEDLKRCNKELYGSIFDSVGKIITYFEGEERDSMLKSLRERLEKNCEMAEQLKCATAISERISQSYDPESGTEEDRNNIIEDYKKQISEIRPDVSNNDKITEFDRIVDALLKDADGKADDNAENNENAELQLTHDTVNIIDPVTKKRMSDPVRNVICGHVYDRESVVALLAVNANSRCPVPGCKHKEHLSMDNMQTDVITKTYLVKHPE